MVYVYAKLSQLNKYIGKELTVEDIEQTLKDMGMDIKGNDQKIDPELKIEITAEKIDMISVVGIARAIRFYKGFQKKLSEYKLNRSEYKIIVDNSVEKVRPKTVAAILRDVKMNEELLNEMIELQEKIHASFGRNRKKAAIGIYPLEEIKSPVYFKAKPPEDIKFQPLESDKIMNGFEIIKEHHIGKLYGHLLEGEEKFPFFEDSKGDILSIPPIINSNKTGRVELHHKDLFIECSGHNLVHLDNVLKVLVTTFIEMGIEAESVKVEYPNKQVYELNLDNIEDTFDLDYVNRLIGFNIKQNEVEKLLNKVMFNLKSINENKITVEIPPYRSDIWHDADIADDIARAYGYNNITARFPNISSVGSHLDFSQFKERFSQTLVQLGFLELYTYMLTSTTTQFDKMGFDIKEFDFIKLQDSADQGINMVRLMILPENLVALNINRKNKYPQKVFENGFTIQPDKSCDTYARNETHLSVSIADPKSNYTKIKEVLDSVLGLNEIKFELKESNHAFLIEGRRADIFVKGEIVGFIGELHPQILDNFGIVVPVSSLEINLDKIFELIK